MGFVLGVRLCAGAPTTTGRRLRRRVPSPRFPPILLIRVGVRTGGSVVCWGERAVELPTTGGDGPAVTVTKGDPGPTRIGQGKGDPCAPNTPTCRYLHIQLSNFDPGTYTVVCAHDGWETLPASTWWTFSVTVGSDGTATVTRQCFINFAKLTGIICRRSATDTAPTWGSPTAGNARSGRIICSRPYAGSPGVSFAMPVGRTVGYSG